MKIKYFNSSQEGWVGVDYYKAQTIIYCPQLDYNVGNNL